MNQIIISKELLMTTRMNRKELLSEIALTLYAKEKLTLEQAAHLAEMLIAAFLALMSSREIEFKFSDQDLEEDIETLNKLGLI